jgi:hypothetical protein
MSRPTEDVHRIAAFLTSLALERGQEADNFAAEVARLQAENEALKTGPRPAPK